MKHAFMTFSTPDLTLEETLALAAQMGYDGIEPRVDNNQKHGIEYAATAAERATAKAAAEKSGVAICCVATSCGYANPETQADQIETTHKAIDLAADVGSTRLRVFGGGMPKGGTHEQAVEQIIPSLKKVADHAAERGVTLCVETHDCLLFPNYLADVLSRVDHAYVMANWDIMHPVRSGGWTMDDAFEKIKPWIRHLHIHDGTLDKQLKMLPIGEGAIDHRLAVELLMGIGFEGYASGEWFSMGAPEDHLPQALAAMKAYEAEFMGK